MTDEIPQEPSEDSLALNPWDVQDRRIFASSGITGALNAQRGGGWRGTKLVMIPHASASSPESEDSTSDSRTPGFDISRSVSRMLTGETCCEHGGRECPSTTTYETWAVHGEHSSAMTSNGDSSVMYPLRVARSLDSTVGYATNQGGTLISSAAASPAKTCPSPDNDEGSCTKAEDPICSSSSPGSLSLFDPDGFSSRTYPVSSLATAVGTSEQSLERWPTSGTAWRGGFSTHVSSECRSDDAGCSSSEPSLSEILEPPQSVPARYSLSARAARGILRRAEKRGKNLPTHLQDALTTVARPTLSEPTTPTETTSTTTPTSSDLSPENAEVGHQGVIPT